MTIRSGRVALVTGASRGLGAAVAKALARAGAHIALAARDLDRLHEVVSQIEATGGVALPVACDVSDLEAVKAAVVRATDVLGPIDILVNNAAIVEPIGSLWTADADAVRQSAEVNYVGAWHVLRAVVPGMMERGYGRVAAVSSIAGAMAVPTFAPYSATKAAFEHLHRIAATEVDGEQVTINWIWPGALDTDMQGQLRDDRFAIADTARQVHAAGLLRDPDEVALRVLELCADDVGMHGQRVVVDTEMARVAGVPV